MRLITHYGPRLLVYLLFSIILSPNGQSFAQPTAQVIMLKGQVSSVVNGQSVDLKQGDWVEENAEIQTAEKSFAKFELKDRSQLTVGPKSKMNITKGPDKGTGLINLIGGQLRAKVQKTQPAKAPKLIIKTKNAAMGVRGTEFEVSFNQASGLSNLLTFEGQVASIRIEAGQISSLSQLSGELSRGQVTIVNSGQYTAINAQNDAPMEPVRINPMQLSSLRANETLIPTESKLTNKELYQSPVPPGAPAGALTNTSDSLDRSLSQSLGQDGMQMAELMLNEATYGQGTSTGSMRGLSDSGIREGGFYDPRIGYIVPASNSPIDPNTGLSLPTSDVGGVSIDGKYLPPAGLAVTDDGQFVTMKSLNSPSETKDLATTSIPVAVTSNEEAIKFMKMESTTYDISTTTNSATDALVDEIVQTNTAAITDSQNTNTGITANTDVSFNVSIKN